MNVQDVKKFTRGALAFGIIMILAITFRSDASTSFDHLLIIGGISGTGLAAFCWIILTFSKMIEESA